MQLAPHLHRIGNDIVAAYLVDSDEGVTVIDAGLAGHWRELVDELAAMERSLDDVRGLIVTHGDGDHLGFAERLRGRGIPIYVHAADAERAKGGPSPKTSMPKMKIFPTLQFFAYMLRKGGLRTRHPRDVVEIASGETLALPGAPEIIGMPGHSPGSVAVSVPFVDAVFVGDALTTRHVLTAELGPAPAPFTDDPQLALQSLDAIAGLPATWLLPGHGAPWRGDLVEAVRLIRARASDSAALG